MSLDTLLFQATLAAYGLASALALTDLFGRWSTARAARLTLLAGFGLHCATLTTRIAAAGLLPLAGRPESLAFFSWAMVALFLLFSRRYPLAVLSAFITPLAFILLLLSRLTPLRPAPTLAGWWLPLHVVLALLGNAAFAVAAGAGILYLMQERMLKSKRIAPLCYRLPALDTLDTINLRCLTLGFPLLTLSMVFGALVAESVWGSYWRWGAKESWALLSWFLFAILLHGRLAIGWRGRKAAQLAIAGFICLLFTFVGVNLLFSGWYGGFTPGAP